MHTVERIVHADCPADQTWARIADYESAPRWDPRLQSVVRLRGDGDVGSAYRVQVRYDGLSVQGVLGVSRFRPGEVIQLHGDLGGLRVTETLIVIRGRYEAYVHWLSEAEVVGGGEVPSYLAPSVLTRLGDDVVAGLSTLLAS